MATLKREPYLAVEHRFLEKVPAIAAASGRPVAEVGWGCLSLWLYCWRAKVESVPRLVVEGFVPGCWEALLAFDQVRVGVEGLPAGHCSIVGLDRYSRIRDARAEGARRTNAQRTLTANSERPAHDERTPSAGKIEDRRSKLIPSPGSSEPEVQVDLLEVQPTQPPAKKARKEARPSIWAEAWERMKAARSERLANMGLEDVPDPVTPAQVNVLLRKAAENLPQELLADPRKPPEDLVEDLVAVWSRFLWSAYWAGRDPAFPLQAFASPKVLAKSASLWGTAQDPVIRQVAYP